VTSTSTSVYVSTFTSVLNAKTTTTVTSTITQPAAGANTDGPDNNDQTSAPSGGGTGNGGATGGGDSTGSGGATGGGGGSGGGLSTGAKAGIGAGSAVGAVAIFAIIFFLWRRHREKQSQGHNDTLAAAAGLSSSPHTDNARRPMTGGESAKYAATSVQMHQSPSERYSDLMPTNGTTSPSPPYAPVAYGHHELASSPAPQQFYPRPPSPRTAEMYSPPHSVEMYHPVPVEVSGLHSPRPQPAHPTYGTNPSYADEWRR
jgi:hypothetical protein